MTTRQDGFFRVREISLPVEGVTGNHVFWQFSDVHLNVSDGESTPEEQWEARKREGAWDDLKELFAGLEGDTLSPERMVSSRTAMEHIVRLMQGEKPEAVLFSGDILDTMDPAGERYLRRALPRMGTTVLCAPGNHEAKELDGVWEGRVQVYSGAGFRIAAVDDRNRTVTEETLTGLKTLCADGVPTVLMMHVPLKTDYNADALKSLDPYFFLSDETADETGRAFLRFVETQPAIRLVLCGHVHQWLDSEIVPGKRQLVCAQSITGNGVKLTVCGKNS